MGCPYNAKFVFGIIINNKQMEELNNRIDNDNSLTEDDCFETYCDENERKFYLDLTGIYNVVDNCEYLKKMPLNTLEKDQENAINNFKKSKLMQEYFKESDITGLLICEYVG